MSSSLDDLRRWLAASEPGDVEDRESLAEILRRAWDDITGSGATQMGPWKLDRLEHPRWDPPDLSFDIERHGAIVGGGSTRAEVQTWTVNVDTGSAEWRSQRRRQVAPMARRLDVRPLAVEVAALILAEADDARLRWTKDRRAVMVVTANLLPPAYQQTTTGRRKRLQQAIAEQLEPSGWRLDGNYWRKTEPSE
jgi:hypothetical protein